MTLLFVLTAILPHEPPTVREQVDLLELNHVQCPQTGRETLTQVIYWRWHEGNSRNHVTAWRMAKLPELFGRDGREWTESREDGPVRRIIRAKQFRETWTFHDPEIEDRQLLPADQRRGLRKP